MRCPGIWVVAGGRKGPASWFVYFFFFFLTPGFLPATQDALSWGVFLG